jgi:hypothetical protein
MPYLGMEVSAFFNNKDVGSFEVDCENEGDSDETWIEFNFSQINNASSSGKNRDIDVILPYVN